MKKTILALCAFGAIFVGCNEKKDSQNITELLKSKETWNIISLENKEKGKEKIVNFGDDKGSEYNLGFKEEGFFGNFGCNSVFGSYKIENETLEFSNAGATKKMCPPEIMENEDALMKGILSNKIKIIVNKDSSISLQAENISVILK